MTPKVVYPEYDDSVEEDEIFQSEDSQVFLFKTDEHEYGEDDDYGGGGGEGEGDVDEGLAVICSETLLANKMLHLVLFWFVMSCYLM